MLNILQKIEVTDCVRDQLNLDKYVVYKDILLEKLILNMGGTSSKLKKDCRMVQSGQFALKEGF